MARRLKNMTLSIKDAEIIQSQLPSGDLSGLGSELESTCGGTYVRCDSTYAPDFDLEATTISNPALKGG